MQNWSLQNLDTLAQRLETDVKSSKKKSFIVKQKRVDSLTKLRFDIVKHVIGTKLDEQDAATERSEVRAHNQKILEKIESAEDKGLDALSVKELRKLLK